MGYTDLHGTHLKLEDGGDMFLRKPQILPKFILGVLSYITEARGNYSFFKSSQRCLC
jgi:hypothetical protein